MKNKYKIYSSEGVCLYKVKAKSWKKALKKMDAEIGSTGDYKRKQIYDPINADLIIETDSGESTGFLTGTQYPIYVKSKPVN